MAVLYILLFLSVNVLHLPWYKVLKNGIKNKEKSVKFKKNMVETKHLNKGVGMLSQNWRKKFRDWKKPSHIL